MRKIILLKVAMLFLFSINIYCQNQDIKGLDVDSLFLEHFISLDKEISCDSIDVVVSTNDRKFVYVISFLSGIPFIQHSYTGHPMLSNNKLIEYKQWYLRYRKKVNYKSYAKALGLLDRIMEISIFITDEQLFDYEINKAMKELEELKIE